MASFYLACHDIQITQFKDSVTIYMEGQKVLLKVTKINKLCPVFKTTEADETCWIYFNPSSILAGFLQEGINLNSEIVPSLIMGFVIDLFPLQNGAKLW